MDWPLVAAVVTVLVLVVQGLLASSASLRNSFERKWGEASGQFRTVLFRRLSGVLLYGAVPAAAALAAGQRLSDLGFNFARPGRVFLSGGALAAVLVAVNVLAGKGAAHLAAYPEIRLARWRPGHLAASAAGWTAYLVAYEFLFRGFFLFSLAAAVGLGWATAANTAVYALAHLPKGPRETLGAIPLGVVLCLVSFDVGNIGPAVLAHLALALSGEWLSLARNPTMSVGWKR
ncbi:MAG: CPBP family intramembrane metalloprotease [Candidatus Aminicenantes bacterium]|nr:CPBP family intramembrane metalloprotease [Candidatus Aminicenantes bacterium]